MAKLKLDKLRAKYPAGTVTGERYQDLMNIIIADNREKVAKRILKITDDNFAREAKKAGTSYKTLVLPDVTDVLPKRSVFINKGAERGTMITDSLRDKLTRDLREVLSQPDYITRRGKLSGTLRKQALADFKGKITETFEGYSKTKKGFPVPANIEAITRTELRSVVDQIKHDYNSELVKRNPDIESVKVWRHNRQGRRYMARKHHEKLNGHTVGLDENFMWMDDNGNRFSAPYPHHESLPPGEVIACSCECVYKIRKIKIVSQKPNKYERNIDEYRILAKAIVLANRELQKAKAPIGHISDRKDGKYKKIGEGKWEKITDDKNVSDTHIEALGRKIEIPPEAKNRKAEEFYSPEQMNILQERYDKGIELYKKYKDKYNNLSESKKMEMIIRDEISSTDYDFDMPNASWQFLEQGYRNAESGWSDEEIQNRKPKFKVGWRYGEVPEGGQSYNFRDQKKEPGISIMQPIGEEKLKGTYELFNSNPVISWVAGFEIDKRGADGESIFVAPRVIKEQKYK